MSLDLFLLWAAFVPAVTFTALYGFRSRWWRYSEGVNVLLFSFFLSLLSGRSLVLRYTTAPEEPSSWWLRFIVAGIAAVLWQRLVLLIRAQHEARPPRRRVEDR